MFKWVSIHLKGPICGCQVQNLIWRIEEDDTEETEYGILIECQSCMTKLRIPRQQLGAYFELETPYPKQDQPKAPGEIVSTKDKDFLRSIGIKFD